MMLEVQQNFFDAFSVALTVDGNWHDFTFYDGMSTDPEGRWTKNIQVLWVKNETKEFIRYTHGMNESLRFEERLFIVRSVDVPLNARLYTNDYLGIDTEEHKIIEARLKDGLWTIKTQVLGSV